MKKLTGWVPGGGGLSRLPMKLWSWFLEGEKVTGAKFQNETQQRQTFKPSNRGLILDGIGRKRLSLEDSYAHMAVVTPTGGGKTSQYILPNILTLDNCSMVMTDPSGEIYQQTSGYLKSKGFDIKVINLADPSKGIGYNPVAKATSQLELDKLAHTLMRSANPVVNPADKIWYDEPETLIAILLRCMKNTGRSEWMNLHNLQHLLQNFGNDGRNLLDFVAKYSPDQATRNAFKGFVTSNEKMRSSFLTMAKNSLRLLNNTEIASMMVNDDLDFDDLRKRKTAVYIIIPEEDAHFYSFIVNLFYTQLFAAQKQIKYKSQGLPLFVLYDEFGQSFIPNFDTIATTIRKFRVSLSIMIQDVAQLKEKYGENAAKTIISGGMRSKLFYSGLDLETSQMVEQMLGKVKIKKKQSGSTHIREENLLNADRIRRIASNEAIYISSNKEPIMLQTTPHFKHPIMKKKAAMGAHPLRSGSVSKLEYIIL